MPTPQTDYKVTPAQTQQPTRYYLIGVKVGSQADKLTDRLVHSFNNDPAAGLVDHAQVTAPTMPYAVAKMAHIFGFAQALLLHLQAQLTR